MADLATLPPPVADVPVRVGARTVTAPEFHSVLDRKTSQRKSSRGLALLLAALAGGMGYIAVHLSRDLGAVRTVSAWPYMLLALALVIALGFEFVNGFHDTANAVATVIYTNSLAPNTAVVLSGLCNLAGVLISSGAVAFAIVTLLPVDLILQVASGAGFAMVFALLIAAILWNLGTWWLGLPSSSSHTLVGSILGVGLANQLLSPHSGTSGLDWEQVKKVLESLLISPVIGFTVAGLLLLAAKWLVRYPTLYEAPRGNEPPPFAVRALMVLNCMGVSVSHGSNDGQKGMGLIMLILIGTVPTAYALNHAVSPAEVQDFLAASERAAHVLERYEPGKATLPASAAAQQPRAVLTQYIRTRELRPETVGAVRQMVEQLNGQVGHYREYKALPEAEQANVRNDLYVTSESLRLMEKAHAPHFTAEDEAALNNYKSKVDRAIKYIPDWVKVAVALALGLGTMVGWRRVVVTVGEKIGKDHLTYAQGASAGLVTMGTIFAANTFGLPVSTTHILSSGIAGTMAANGSGLRLKTVRNIAAGWVFTLPAAALLAGLLYWAFRQLA